MGSTSHFGGISHFGQVFAKGWVRVVVSVRHRTVLADKFWPRFLCNLANKNNPVVQFNSVSCETTSGHWIQRVKKVLKRVTKTILATDYSLHLWMCLPEPHIIQLIPHACRLKIRRKLWTKEGRKEGGKRKKERKIKEAWKTETRRVQPQILKGGHVMLFAII